MEKTKTYSFMAINLRRTIADVAIKYGLEFQENGEEEKITIWGEETEMRAAVQTIKRKYGIIG